MEPILEAKKYSAMTEKELLAEAERLASHEDKTVAGFGRTLKKCVLNKFIDLNEFFTAVSAILFVGGPVLSICIGAIIGALLLLTTLVPFIVLQGALKAQNDFLKTRLKWTDSNAVKYLELSKEIRNRHIRVTTEGYVVVTEAPKEEIIPEDTNDYTDDADDDDEANAGEEPEEEPTPEDNGEDEPVENTEPATTDYTEDEDITDNAGTDDETEPTDDTGDDEPLDPNVTGEEDTTDETGDETGEEEDPEAMDTGDDTTDYTEDGDIGDGETGDTTDDTTTDDTMTDDMGGENEEQSQNNSVKNYNLMIDFKRLFTTTSDILTCLGDVVFKHPIQNQVLDRCIQNIQKIKEQVLNYMEFTFSEKYEDNLYHYNIFVQALKLNLEIMKKNSQLGDSDENS